MIKILINNGYLFLEEMHRHATSLLLFSLSFIHIMFFVYIDDGKYSFAHYQHLEAWVLTTVVSFLFTGIGSILFLLLTQKTDLSWRARFFMAFVSSLLMMTIMFVSIKTLILLS